MKNIVALRDCEWRYLAETHVWQGKFIEEWPGGEILDAGRFWPHLSALDCRRLANRVASLLSLLEGETPQRIPTSGSGRSGFRSTQEIQGTTTYRYNMFILNFMANPMIFRGHFQFPYIPLYLESPHPSPKPEPPVGYAINVKHNTGLLACTNEYHFGLGPP